MCIYIYIYACVYIYKSPCWQHQRSRRVTCPPQSWQKFWKFSVSACLVHKVRLKHRLFRISDFLKSRHLGTSALFELDLYLNLIFILFYFSYLSPSGPISDGFIWPLSLFLGCFPFLLCAPPWPCVAGGEVCDGRGGSGCCCCGGGVSVLLPVCM
jgi:hypothetical protein